MGNLPSSSAGSPSLSWCCIGAQKAGTSTLFTLLSQHPELFIPPGKEEPFFHRPYDEGELAAYLAQHFSPEVTGDRKAGTVTPQYMSSSTTAARLHAAFPHARIVAILRDPVHRAFSHYRMNIRRGLEERSFSSAVADEIDQLDGSGPADPEDEVATYVYRGRYFHLLQPWFDLFGKDHVHIVFTDDLEQDPVGAVHVVHRFLGVEPRTTGDEGVRRHADPPRHRFPQLRRKVTGPLRRAGLLERVPGHVREKLGYRIEATLARFAPPKESVPELEPGAVDLLRDFYAEDREALAKLIGRPTPWR